MRALSILPLVLLPWLSHADEAPTWYDPPLNEENCDLESNTAVYNPNNTIYFVERESGKGLPARCQRYAIRTDTPYTCISVPEDSITRRSGAVALPRPVSEKDQCWEAFFWENHGCSSPDSLYTFQNRDPLPEWWIGNIRSFNIWPMSCKTMEKALGRDQKYQKLIGINPDGSFDTKLSKYHE